nr:putative reverse transcriptase domain-containing protein [Tanacetum cinerariifolium]
MSMTIQSNVKDKILSTPIDTSKVENAPAKMLRDLNQQMEKRADDGKANVATDALSQKEQVKRRLVIIRAFGVLRLKLCMEGNAGRMFYGQRLESSLTGLELVQEMTDKVVLVKEKPKVARDRQKSYVDYRCKPLEGKLAQRYVEPFKILEKIGSIACRLRLFEELSSVHDTFHVSNLKKGLADANLHVPLEEIEADKTLHFVEETMGIMNREI